MNAPQRPNAPRLRPEVPAFEPNQRPSQQRQDASHEQDGDQASATGLTQGDVTAQVGSSGSVAFVSGMHPIDAFGTDPAAAYVVDPWGSAQFINAHNAAFWAPDQAAYTHQPGQMQPYVALAEPIVPNAFAPPSQFFAQTFAAPRWYPDQQYWATQQPASRFVQDAYTPDAQASRPAASNDSGTAHRDSRYQDERVTQLISRWHRMSHEGVSRGWLNLNKLEQIGPQVVLAAVKARAELLDARFAFSGTCVLANAYIDVLNYEQRGSSLHPRASAQRAAIDELTSSLHAALRSSISGLASRNGSPLNRDLSFLVLSLVQDAPKSLAQWLYVAGDASIARATFVDGGQRLRLAIAGASLLLPVDRSGDSAYEAVDIGRLIGLLANVVQEDDARNIARWLCTHAQRGFASHKDQAQEALRTAFQLCPSFDPETLRDNTKPNAVSGEFIAEAWRHCREASLDLALEQAPEGSWENDAPTRAKFWSLVGQLCDRPDPAWRSLLAQVIKATPMYMDALSEFDRPLLADILHKLPVTAATELQVAGLLSWYADNASAPAGQENLVHAAKQFLVEVASETTGSRRAPLYGYLYGYAKDSHKAAIAQTLLDLFPSHERFPGMETITAAQLIMHVEEHYLRAHAGIFENILQVIADGEAPYSDLCSGENASRWQVIASIESLQPVSVSILQREYSQMRPSPSVAHILQRSVAKGTDIEVTRKLEQITADLPADGSLYIRLNMALAERARAVTQKEFGGRSLLRISHRSKPKTLQKALVRIETVLKRSTLSVAAQHGSTEPHAVDFLVQEMRALADADLSEAQELGDKVSAQAMREFGGVLSEHINETLSELLTLTEIMVRQGDFRHARPLTELILSHLSQENSKLDARDKKAIEAKLRAWATESPHDFQAMARTFGALDFAQALRTLHTAPADKRQTSEGRQKVQQDRLRALDKIARALTDTHPDENRARHERLAKFMPQILTLMMSRHEREALGEFWLAALSDLGLEAFDAKAMSLMYANISTSNDVARPLVQRLLGKISDVIIEGLSVKTSAPQAAFVREALEQAAEEEGWARAFKILQLKPKVIAATLPATTAMRMLTAAPMKTLREHVASLASLASCLVKSSQSLQSPWNDDERLALLQEHLSPVSFLRLLDLTGVGSGNVTAQTALRALVTNNQPHVFRALTAPKSEHRLSPQRELYWGVRDALVTVTAKPADLFQQLAEALSSDHGDAFSARALAFLRRVLRHPSMAQITTVEPQTQAILSEHIGNWYTSLRVLDVASRMPETLNIANVWRLTGDLSDARELIEELLAEAPHNRLTSLFDADDAAFVDAAATLFRSHIKTLPIEDRLDGSSTGDVDNAAAHAALRVASLGLRNIDESMPSKAQEARMGFVNIFAKALASSPLLDNVAIGDRASLGDLMGALRYATLDAPQTSALVRRMTHAWLDTVRTSESGRLLASHMEDFLRTSLHGGFGDAATRSRTIVRNTIDYCLRDGQETKAWRLVSLLHNSDDISLDTRHKLLTSSHLCPPQEMRFSVPKVLAGISPASNIASLTDDMGDDKAWSVLLKIPAAASWLAHHIQYIFDTTGDFPNVSAAKWQTAVSRFAPADRDASLMTVISELPPNGPMYLRACMMRLSYLDGEPLVALLLDVMTIRHGTTDGTRLQADEESTLTFLREALRRVNVVGLDETLEFNALQSQTWSRVRTAVTSIPVAERMNETEAIALVSIKVGNWIDAAEAVGTVLANQPVNQPADGLRATERPKMRRWAHDVLCALREQETQHPELARQLRDAASNLILATSHAAFDSPLLAEAFSLIARMAAQDVSLTDGNGPRELLDHVQNALARLYETVGIPKRWDATQFDVAGLPWAPYGAFDEPQDILSPDNQARVEFLAPALAIDWLRLTSAKDDASIDRTNVDKAFAYAMCHPHGANVLLKASQAALKLFGRKDEFRKNLTNSTFQQPDIPQVDSSPAKRHATVQGWLFGDSFYRDFSAGSPSNPYIRVLPRRSDLLKTSVASLETARQSVLGIVKVELEAGRDIEETISYLVQRADVCTGWSSQDEQEFGRLLEAALRQDAERRPAISMLLLRTSSSTAQGRDISPLSDEISHHLGTLAPPFFNALAETGRLPLTDVRGWFRAVLTGLYVDATSPEDVSAPQTWRAIANRLMDALDWNHTSYAKEQLEAQLRQAHGFVDFKALQAAWKTIDSITLIPAGMTQEEYIQAAGNNLIPGSIPGGIVPDFAAITRDGPLLFDIGDIDRQVDEVRRAVGANVTSATSRRKMAAAMADVSINLAQNLSGGALQHTSLWRHALTHRTRSINIAASPRSVRRPKSTSNSNLNSVKLSVDASRGALFPLDPAPHGSSSDATEALDGGGPVTDSDTTT